MNRVSYTQNLICDFTNIISTLNGGFRKNIQSVELTESLNDFKNAVKDGQFWFADQDTTEVLVQTGVDADALNGVRLPQKTTVIEYFRSSDDSPQNVLISKKVVLMVDTGYSILFRPAIFAEKVKKWFPYPAMNISYEAIDNLDNWVLRKGTGYDSWVVKYNPLWVDQSTMSIEDVETRESLITGSMEEIKICLSFLQIISCSNVETECTPTDSKIIKSAKRRGRFSPHEFRTIKISDNLRRSHHESKANPEAAQKRVHWRRGHIRMQPTNNGIIRKWIQPTIVGIGNPKNTPVILKA
jgi:hypothetical protein